MCIESVRWTQQMQRHYLVVHVGDAVVKHHSVGENRARHSTRLVDIRHSEQCCDLIGYLRPQVGNLI